ncbi:unnamed protein product [Gadus morhua 'NCC']
MKVRRCGVMKVRRCGVMKVRRCGVMKVRRCGVMKVRRCGVMTVEEVWSDEGEEVWSDARCPANQNGLQHAASEAVKPSALIQELSLLAVSRPAVAKPGEGGWSSARRAMISTECKSSILRDRHGLEADGT